MAEFETKSKELLKILPDLQCHECKDVPGPSGAKKNRYNCVNECHVLCEKHKAKCACGSLVTKRPSHVIAKILQDLPMMCQNYENGCREMNMDVVQLELHQAKCILRNVFCPSYYCKVLFKDVNDHLVTIHKNTSESPMIEGQANKWMIGFATDGSVREGNWNSVKLTSTENNVLYIAGCIEKDAFHSWIYMLGSPEEVKNFSFTQSVTNKDKEKYTFSGPVYPLDKDKFAIIASEATFRIGTKAFKRSLNENMVLNIEVTIRNLKEEAKDDAVDSGVSEDE